MTPLEHESTFERHFEDFPDFLKKILAWRPDYLVPVAKKACKLLKTLPDINAFQKNPDLIKYRNYFKLTNAEIHNKRISILDDATQYMSTLQEYRRYFESLGAIVRTFSFDGHEAVVEGVRWKEDPLAEISKSLSEPAYQEYILQQSYHLLTSGNHFDLDHLVFAVPMAEAQLDHFLEIIRRHGLLLFTDDHRVQTQARRFSLNDARFFGDVPFLSHPSVAFGPLRKIKFDFDAASKTLFFSPLVFPTWHFSRCDVGAGLFRDVPFTIPFAVPRTIDKKNEGALLRVYTNLYFVCAVSFAKAFAQHVLKPNGWADDVRLRHNDLDALLGFAATQKLIPQIMTFVSNDDRYDFAGDRWKEESLDHRKGKYSDFGQVIDDLKRGYEQKLEKKRSRIGVHYYFTYDHLFQRFRNQTALSEGLDYYCDFGIVVPETIIDRNNGRVVRACRAGEPKFDYDWLRNQVLIPLAIDLFVSKDSRAKGIDATLLNKVLANFIFDYPGEVYPQLHCLVGEPYLYGTFIRVYHPQRACRKPSLYESSRISDFYSWNDSKKAFFLKQPRKLANAARQVFDQHQEVPYSEIVTYFRFLARVYSIFKRSKRLKRHVDALNMFSICGEENHFLAHVLFNVTRALEDIGLTFAENKVETRKCLREARGQAEAAADKLDFCAFAEEAMKIVN